MKKIFKFGITLEDVNEGILVKQYDTAYIARNWKITKEVIEMVDACLESGMRWMIRSNHPKRSNQYPNKKGVVYLAFSPTRDNQWSMAIDTFNPNTNKFRFGIFNGKYKNQFDKNKISYNFEGRNKNSGHMMIDRDKLFSTIKKLAVMDHSILFFDKKNIKSDGFIAETDMQRFMILNWQKTPFKSYEFIGDEYPVRIGRNPERIDLLGFKKKTKTFIVIELKKNEALKKDLGQVLGYCNDLKNKKEFKNFKIKPVLIAERISKDVKENANKDNIDTYELNWPGKFSKI